MFSRVSRDGFVIKIDCETIKKGRGLTYIYLKVLD